MAFYIVDKGVLRKNAKIVMDRCQSKVIAVVKANGYGLGIRELTSELALCGIRDFAVTEAGDVAIASEELTTYSNATVYVIRPTCLYDDIEAILKANAICTISSIQDLRSAEEVAARGSLVARAQVKVDVGFGRYGFYPDQVDEILKCYASSDVQIVGIFAHFPSASMDLSATKRQLDQFKALIERLQDRGVQTGLVNIANSPAIFNLGPESGVDFDAVRIGSAFTGRVLSLGDDPGLRNVGHLEGKVFEIREMRKGSTIGYGSPIALQRDSLVAFAEIGTLDGFGIQYVRPATFRQGLSTLRRAGKGSGLEVMISDRPYPVIGEVDLTSCMIDVTGSDVRVGDVVRADVNPLFVPESVERIYI